MPAGKIRNSLVFETLRKFSLLLGYSSEKFNGSKLQAATLTNGSFLQNETSAPTKRQIHHLLQY
jgi:hypothetical protein